MAAGDVVCEIQTDKAVMSMEADEEGVLAKIVKGADTGAIKVGEVIAVVAEDGEDWREVAAAPLSGGQEAPKASAEAPVTSEVMSGGSTPGTVINMPSFSPTNIKWYKPEDESITARNVT